MNNIETKVYLETKLRNLRRKHAKLAQHAHLAEEYFEIGKQIDRVEDEINLM